MKRGRYRIFEQSNHVIFQNIHQTLPMMPYSQAASISLRAVKFFAEVDQQANFEDKPVKKLRMDQTDITFDNNRQQHRQRDEHETSSYCNGLSCGDHHTLNLLVSTHTCSQLEYNSHKSKYSRQQHRQGYE